MAIGRSGRIAFWGQCLGLCLGLIAAPDALASRSRIIIRQPAAKPASPPPVAGDAASAEDDDSATLRDTGPENGETLDNGAVIKLAKAGLPATVVAEMIRTTRGHYDISTPALVALSQAGVPGSAIAAMIKVARKAQAEAVRSDSPDPAAPHPAGVYVLARWLPDQKMLAIKPITTTRTTSGSILGYAYAGGLIPVSYRAIVPQPHAAMLAGETRPTFYFFTGSNESSQHLATVWGAAPSPDDVSLVRFLLTRNGREIKIGSFNLRGAKVGIDARDALPFTVSDVAPGVIAVQPQIDLAPGEYGFVQTSAGVGVGGAQAQTSSARVFDFAIADAATLSAGIVSREGASGSAEQVQGSASPVVVQIGSGGYGRGGSRKAASTLTAAQKEAARPCHYPGGPSVPGSSQP